MPAFNNNCTFRLATGLYYQAPFYKEMRDTITVNGLTRAVLNENIKSQRSLQDYFPGTDRWKMTLRLAFADGLPFGAPHRGLESQQFRTPAYKRADIGMSFRAIKEGKVLKNLWLGVDCLNLFGISNVNSYYWVTDVTNKQWAVPNYLTGRQVNGKITVEF